MTMPGTQAPFLPSFSMGGEGRCQAHFALYAGAPSPSGTRKVRGPGALSFQQFHSSPDAFILCHFSLRSHRQSCPVPPSIIRKRDGSCAIPVMHRPSSHISFDLLSCLVARTACRRHRKIVHPCLTTSPARPWQTWQPVWTSHPFDPECLSSAWFWWLTILRTFPRLISTPAPAAPENRPSLHLQAAHEPSALQVPCRQGACVPSSS